MVAKRNQRFSDLGDSWADVSSDEETHSESGESLDIGASDEEQPSVRNMHTGSPKLDKTVNQTPSKVQHSPRTASSQRMANEPSLVMPSMLSSGQLKTPTRASPLSSSMRARKSGTMTASGTTPKRRQKQAFDISPKQSKQPRRTPAETSNNSAFKFWSNFVAPTISYAFSIFGYAMLYLKPLFGAILAILLVFFGLKTLFKSSLGALSLIHGLDMNLSIPSLCDVPIFRSLPVICSTGPGASPEFDGLVEIQSSFEEILESTAQGSSLPADMKRSEASIRDLKYVVAYSQLPSRQELALEFEGFVDLAKQASRDLTTFNSKVGGAVDHIISINKHTLRVIDGYVLQDAEQGALSQWLWGSSGMTQKHLMRQYLLHTNSVEEQILQLISCAQELLRLLENLDNRLDTIHSIITRDGVNVKESRDELFAHLWTKLGGNRHSVEKLNEQLRLLKSVNSYRKAAWTQVAATLLKLQAIAAGLEDLRERVALPETLGVETIPIQQHIETIQLGLDRLEQVRDGSRMLESERSRRILDGEDAVPKDRMVDGRKPR